MPPQPKKKSPKKSQAPRTKRVKNNQTLKTTKNVFQRDILIALAMLLLVGVVGAGYYWDRGDLSFERPVEIQRKAVASATLEKKIPLKGVSKESGQTEASAAEQIDRQREHAMNAFYKEVPAQRLPSVQPPVVDRSKRPRLVIIIDDVAYQRQLNEILLIPLRLTPSLFPPSSASKETIGMAKKHPYAMVHFPMQAGNNTREAMPSTMRIHDSVASMKARVKELRKWFPSTVYVNNHTGSVFTADYRALYTMYGLLKAEGFVFVDSRTSSSSKGREVAQAYGDFYLSRDVFIDNVPKFGVIREQLKAAVKQAKKQGYAIAIGHPHPMTLRSLKNSLDILVDVDVVYMDALVK